MCWIVRQCVGLRKLSPTYRSDIRTSLQGRKSPFSQKSSRLHQDLAFATNQIKKVLELFRLGN